ncbi:aminopeptidase C [Porphyromonas crevioricanis JCM 15906]|uniref:Aminopeptidase n=1 Tax=Porphyromonas crevioricanis JCM 15906 TaxID=1305617 RepID=T1CGZ3_9PORP|nr:C1 family peptidase [Porphyromonas crevioricanis]GAD05056.1 aminopeptidase C [Porphyromonas crevioricanis JCM 15906]SJZ97210.1 bleomycin hydrolase [Porphyromonas crevioricanis]
MKRQVFLLTALALALQTMPSAAQKDGGISSDMLQEIKSAFQHTPSDIAIRNAVMANGMKALVTNADHISHLDDHFSHRVKSKGISDQKQSGRCWLFTGLNVMRAPIIEQYGLDAFFFSHNYSFFYDQLEKANLFLQSVIDTKNLDRNDREVEWLFQHPIGDGGQFTGVSDNILKYGLVPQSVMPETLNSNNTQQLGSMLAQVLRQGGIRIRQSAATKASPSKLQQQKVEILKQVYRLLVLNLGEPPTKFEYTLRDKGGKILSTETYTPQSFYQKFVGKDLKNDFIMVMNDPSRPYHRLYSIKYDRHSYDGKNWTYVNLPIEELKELAIASIKDNTMLYYSCDVGKSLDKKRGFLDLDQYDYESLLGIKFDMNKQERIESYDSGSTHAMTLVAVDLDKNGKPKKWMVENSWGAEAGMSGYLVMTDDWFDAYTFRIVVDRKYASEKVLKILDTKPALLPPWDPMFAPEN